MNDLTAELAALLGHLGCSRREFHLRLVQRAPRLERFGYSTLTGALKGHWPTGPARAFIENALKVYASELGISLDQLARQHTTQTSTHQTGPLHEYLKGAWFLIQYRGKRDSMSHAIAEPDFRTGIVVYGGLQKEGRAFTLIGESTVWYGHVSPHSWDNLLYYSAREISRPGIEESITMVMLSAYAAGRIVDHHGIILGVARGDHDAPSFPIYASRVLLWRIRNYRNDATAPLDEEEIAKLKSYCGYVSHDNAARMSAQGDDPLIQERKEAIARFITRGQSAGNFGDRIFVRG